LSKHDILFGVGKNANALATLQSYSLAGKIAHSLRKIKEWYEYWQGNVYVAFSGGKDSTVLLHLVRSLYPEVPAVFSDTGLEYPEIREFVKSVDNVIWVRPKLSFNKVIEKYGWPIVSKEQAQYISEAKSTTSDALRALRMNGRKGHSDYTSGKISEKWKYLLNAPFNISHRCCDVMKKSPMGRYEQKSGRHPYIGTMASESRRRQSRYSLYGCNAYKLKKPSSAPLSFWYDVDVWAYIRQNSIAYSPIYDLGYERTGCMFCLFGHHMGSVNKIDHMKKTHPKQYAYCMEKLGMKEVLDWYPDKASSRIEYEDVEF